MPRASESRARNPPPQSNRPMGPRAHQLFRQSESCPHFVHTSLAHGMRVRRVPPWKARGETRDASPGSPESALPRNEFPAAGGAHSPRARNSVPRDPKRASRDPIPWTRKPHLLLPKPADGPFHGSHGEGEIAASGRTGGRIQSAHDAIFPPRVPWGSSPNRANPLLGRPKSPSPRYETKKSALPWPDRSRLGLSRSQEALSPISRQHPRKPGRSKLGGIMRSRNFSSDRRTMDTIVKRDHR